MNDLYVVTSAFPFVPAELNLAHFSSTYIPADICARFLRMFNKDVINVCATDYHSFYASTDGNNIDYSVCEKFDKEYKKLFDIMNVKFDNYINTSEDNHKENVKNAIYTLSSCNKLDYKTGYFCECNSCGARLPLTYIEDKFSRIDRKECPFCGGVEFSKENSNHCFLKLSDEHEFLKEEVSNVVDVNLKNFLLSTINSGLVDWDFTRDNKYGMEFPYDSNLSIYLWFDSLVGYYSLIPNKYKEKNINFMHFFGKNIIYYHGIIWPVMTKYLYNNVKIKNVSARGFLLFDKTDSNIVNLEEFSKRYDSDYLRFYIASKVKDNIEDFSFTEGGFKFFINNIFIKKIANLNYRIYCILKKGQYIPNDISFIDFELTKKYLKEFNDDLFSCNINDMYKKIISFASEANVLVSDSKFRESNNYDYIFAISMFLSLFISPFMPNIAKKMCILEDYSVVDVNKKLELKNAKIKDSLEKYFSIL